MAIRSRSTRRCRPLFRWLVCEGDGLKLVAGARIRLERNPKMNAKISALDDLINAALDLFLWIFSNAFSLRAQTNQVGSRGATNITLSIPNLRGIYRQGQS